MNRSILPNLAVSLLVGLALPAAVRAQDATLQSLSDPMASEMPVPPPPPQPPSANELFQAGFKYWQTRQFQLAIDNFNYGLSLDPNIASGWRYLGLSQAALGQEDQARSSFGRAMALSLAEIAALKVKIADANLILSEITESISSITPLQLNWLGPLRLPIKPQAVQNMEQEPALRTGRRGVSYGLTIEEQSFTAQPASQCTAQVPADQAGKGVTAWRTTSTEGRIDPPFVYGTGTIHGGSCLKKDQWSVSGDTAQFSVYGLLADARRSSRDWLCTLKKCRSPLPASESSSLELDQFAMSKAIASLAVGEQAEIRYSGTVTEKGVSRQRSMQLRCTLKGVAEPKKYLLAIPENLRELDCTMQDTIAAAAPTSMKMLFSDALQADLYSLGIVANPADASIRIIKIEGRLGSPGDKLTVTSNRTEGLTAWSLKTVTLEQAAPSAGSAK